MKEIEGKGDMTEKMEKSSHQISEKKQNIKYDTRDYVIGYLKKYGKMIICMFRLIISASSSGEILINAFL